MANASHELRTPLAIMRASTEVALRGIPKNDTDKRELLGDVLQETDHMSSLVEDLLLLSRLDAGRLKMEQTECRGAQDAFRYPAPGQSSCLQARRQSNVRDAAGTAWGDPARLRQVLIILVDNALRHTPGGGSVTLSARAMGTWFTST